MKNYDLTVAHKASSHNKNTLERDNKCGCFYCLRVFSPSEIKEWCDESENEEGVTAICPYCDVDAILSESAGFPLTKEFLTEMRKRWFYKVSFR